MSEKDKIRLEDVPEDVRQRILADAELRELPAHVEAIKAELQTEIDRLKEEIKSLKEWRSQIAIGAGLIATALTFLWTIGSWLVSNWEKIGALFKSPHA